MRKNTPIQYPCNMSWTIINNNPNLSKDIANVAQDRT